MGGSPKISQKAKALNQKNKTACPVNLKIRSRDRLSFI
ncbi:hypothetical protein CHCC20441_4118 [Bacillus licheniformis]|uniref:Uncharacterized protein n=1 Tax=Bacillus licheniformis TaxID=1402 RepID=A0A8B5Y5F9_BACLI|nr:hypothetical protein B4092_2288 [Bacillus licheniformis]TWN16587.1 hypothetical protein CHCC14564_1152 [Bacillus licheniformis LMG 17339]KYC75630.1 hypothetical protein B4090_2316 [Bacillus licheniformis]KYC83800.1 hypothetical protein B4091_2378 [Bacillus licheniformis]KYD01463.1 hypothetical protein B4164_2146 [Bacillus licheniformis]